MKQANKIVKERGGRMKMVSAEVFSTFIIHDLSSSSINGYKGEFRKYYIGYRLFWIIEYRQNVLGFLSCLQSGYIKRVIYRQTNRFRPFDSMRFNRVLPFVRRYSCESRDIGLLLPCRKTILLIAYLKGVTKYIYENDIIDCIIKWSYYYFLLE